MILKSLIERKNAGKVFAWLIDPDKSDDKHIDRQLESANEAGVDLILVGGSLIFNHVDQIISRIRRESVIPVVLFPGSPIQLSSDVDAILFLSLISGRNADYLIGNHVIAAPFLKESGIEIIPTGYMLIDGGQATSVSYMSNTQPVPADKYDIALATAMAGEMLGLKVIYLDAGSGAIHPVQPGMIQKVAGGISVPLMVGGGIRTPAEVRRAYECGADVVIVGTAAESTHTSIKEMTDERDRFNT